MAAGAVLMAGKALKFLPYITGTLGGIQGFRQGGLGGAVTGAGMGALGGFGLGGSWRINSKRYKNGRKYGNTTSFRKYRKSGCRITRTKGCYECSYSWSIKEQLQ